MTTKNAENTEKSQPAVCSTVLFCPPVAVLCAQRNSVYHGKHLLTHNVPAQRHMKTKDLKKSPEASSGGPLEPVGSENACPNCSRLEQRIRELEAQLTMLRDRGLVPQIIPQTVWMRPVGQKGIYD